MISNYFKIAWRNIWKSKLFSAINIVSLAIGLSASFVIGMMIYHDFSFDKFHPDKDRIYRITSQFKSPEGVSGFTGVNVPLMHQMKEGFLGVEAASSFFIFQPYQLIANNSRYKDSEGAIFTDKTYFEIFQYEWLAGNKDTLDQPNQVVLTQNKAEKYFPGTPLNKVIGETITYNDSTIVDISGIVADFKENSDLIFDEFISLPTAVQSNMKATVTNESWSSSNSNAQLFILVDENAKLSDLQQRLDELAKEHQNKELAEDGMYTSFALQPLDELHFSKYGIFGYGNNPSDKSVLIALLAIALFLLALGCINFINLNTAQATQRAKEIGIRKTLGSSKIQLVYQFLGETFLLTLLSGIVSIFFGYVLFKVFGEFFPTSFQYNLILQPQIIVGIVLLLAVVSLLAGTYPALILSQFKPVSVLKNRIFFKSDKAGIRKFLTFFQFGIAQVFIIATLLVGKQIYFMMHKDLGFKSSEIAYFNFPDEDGNLDKRYRLKNELENNPKIDHLSLGSAPPASYRMFGSKLTYTGDEGEVNVYFDQIFGDTNYLELYDIPLLAGRKPLNDSIREYVINETLMNEMGMVDPKEVINKTIKIGEKSYPVVGVMQDFNQRSLKAEIGPIAFMPDIYSSTQFSILSFTINPNNHFSQTMDDIRSEWKQLYPESDFKIEFMDETIASFYEKEQSLAKLLRWATGLSILISSLGLLGLVIYTIERKNKEIGIRKVLGATLFQLNTTLCKEFIAPILLAVVVAIPIAWYGLNKWLQNFEYRTDSNWWVFVCSAFLMVFVAVVVMGIKTIQAAMKNPAKSLRTE